MSSSWQIQLCIKYKLQLINNTVLSFKLILKVGSVHFKIWPCLRRLNLACNAVHSLLIVLEHLHTKLSRCNALPFLQHTAFYILSLLSCYFNLAKERESKLPKDYLCVELSKKSAYPAIDFHFLCSWLGFLFLAGSRSVVTILTAPRVLSETLVFLMELVSLLHQRNETLSPKMGVKQRAITIKKRERYFWLAKEQMRRRQNK